MRFNNCFNGRTVFCPLVLSELFSAVCSNCFSRPPAKDIDSSERQAAKIVWIDGLQPSKARGKCRWWLPVPLKGSGRCGFKAELYTWEGHQISNSKAQKAQQLAHPKHIKAYRSASPKKHIFHHLICTSSFAVPVNTKPHRLIA